MPKAQTNKKSTAKVMEQGRRPASYDVARIAAVSQSAVPRLGECDIRVPLLARSEKSDVDGVLDQIWRHSVDGVILAALLSRAQVAQGGSDDLTTIRQPVRGMTDAALARLVERIEEACAPPEQRPFTGELPAGSTARIGRVGA